MTAPERQDAFAGGGTPDQPVRSAERLVSLDFIRGVAVLGILFANITAFAHPMLAYMLPDQLPGGGTATDELVWLFQFIFVDGKFRGLFTVLFGAGMYLFMERAWARGASRWLQGRRLFWLLLFGLAHFYFLFVGDILFMYSIAGFMALAMLMWSARTQLRIGIAWLLVGALLFSAMVGSQALLEGSPELREQEGVAEQWQVMVDQRSAMIADSAAERQVVSGGSYGAIVAYRFAEQSETLVQYLVMIFFETIPLMLIGMGLYRMGFFSGAFDRTKMRRWGWIGLIAGVLASVPLGYAVLDRDFPFFFTQFMFVGPSAFPRFAMVLGLLALLVLAAPRAAKSWLGERLVAAGRMAFSNYIGTSVLMTLVFHGWAGGLYGQLSRLELLPVVLLAWVAMLAWSKPWLAYFRYGPLEWLWRCLTYGRLFPFRRTTAG